MLHVFCKSKSTNCSSSFESDFMGEKPLYKSLKLVAMFDAALRSQLRITAIGDRSLRIQRFGNGGLIVFAIVMLSFLLLWWYIFLFLLRDVSDFFQRKIAVGLPTHGTGRIFQNILNKFVMCNARVHQRRQILLPIDVSTQCQYTVLYLS